MLWFDVDFSLKLSTILCVSVIAFLFQWQHPSLLPTMPMQQQATGFVSQGPGRLTSQASAGQQGDRLEQSNSFRPTDAITTDNVITAGELELITPIGVGAEGKVRDSVCWVRVWSFTGMGSVRLVTRRLVLVTPSGVGADGPGKAVGV